MDGETSLQLGNRRKLVSNKIQERQRFIRYYKENTGKKTVDMHDVAKFAVKMGHALPVPPDPIDILAKQYSDAAREETRVDKETKRPYRANLAFMKRLPNGKQLGLWIDTDEAPRHQMEKALTLYREQMVGEALIGTNTAEHWNAMNPMQRPLVFPTDLGPDVQWRQNAPEEEDQAS
jgi:hypothetical protein